MIDVYYEFGNALYFLSATFALLIAILSNFNEDAFLPYSALWFVALVGASVSSYTLGIMTGTFIVSLGLLMVYLKCRQQ